jgi:hypothetical protein
LQTAQQSAETKFVENCFVQHFVELKLENSVVQDFGNIDKYSITYNEPKKNENHGLLSE